MWAVASNGATALLYPAPPPEAKTKGTLMQGTPKEQVRTRAEAEFKKKEIKANANAQGMADYIAEGRAVREKTARLRSLRLAKQAADPSAGSVTGTNGASKPRAKS
jgi:hypothetical protein